MSKKKTNKEIIQEFKQIHNDKYNYSKVDYINNKTKVCIICSKHGEFFQQPSKHLQGQGCPKCYGNVKSTTEEFIKKAQNLYNDKYNYSKVDYVNNTTKVCIICPEHGEFWQTPHNHLKGQGCPACGKIKSGTCKLISFDDFLKKANEIHSYKYDYVKNTYKLISQKMCIICPEHGKFDHTPYSHLQGQGCPICGNLKIWENRDRMSQEEFINKSNLIHHNKYTYNKSIFITLKTPLLITCPIHGDFEQTPDSHLRGSGCPKCSNHISLPEKDIISFIQSFENNEIITNNRKILDSQKELDIFLPNNNLAIEYNGLIWHSEKFNKNKNYHLDKLNECNNQGIKLIHIFEDEWLEHKDVVLSKIKHLLKKDGNLLKVQARKCVIKEINKEESRNFLEKNHIQGFVLSTIYLGCYHNDDLVGVMTFKEEKKGNNKWELNRFATDITKHCVGVGGKLFTYFIKNYNPDYIKSFADRRWTLDKDINLYTKLGFKLTETLRPDYRYVNGLRREHKFGYRKHTLLRKYLDKGLTEEMTEKEMCDKLGFYRIWDCGLFKYEWKNNSNNIKISL